MIFPLLNKVGAFPEFTVQDGRGGEREFQKAYIERKLAHIRAPLLICYALKVLSAINKDAHKYLYHVTDRSKTSKSRCNVA